MNREELNRKQKERRLLNGNKTTKKYEKTKKGFLVRCYRNMKSRITGVQKVKFYLYEGKYLLDKELFYLWFLNDDKFNKLFEVWEENGYNNKLTPSVDRVDSSIGYHISNMEWVTHSENSRRGSLNRFKNKLHK